LRHPSSFGASAIKHTWRSILFTHKLDIRHNLVGWKSSSASARVEICATLFNSSFTAPLGEIKKIAHPEQQKEKMTLFFYSPFPCQRSFRMVCKCVRYRCFRGCYHHLLRVACCMRVAFNLRRKRVLGLVGYGKKAAAFSPPGSTIFLGNKKGCCECM